MMQSQKQKKRDDIMRHITRIFFTMTFFTACSLTEKAQSAPQDQDENQPRQFKVFPKRKGILIEQTESEKQNPSLFRISYPEGRTPDLIAIGVDGDSYKIVFPRLGIVKVADFYKIEDLLAMNINKVAKSEDDWLKFIVADAHFTNHNYSIAYELLKLISSKNKDSYEVRYLNSEVKFQSKLYDSALLDIAAILKSKGDPSSPDSSSLHENRAMFLIKNGAFEAALRELANNVEVNGKTDAGLAYYRAQCNFKLRKYQDVISNLPEELPEDLQGQVHFFVLGELWIACKSMALRDKPLFDDALKHLDSSRFNNSTFEFLTTLDACFIYSCRSDINRRNGKRALELLAKIKGHKDYDIYVKDYTMAEALANLEVADYDQAAQCLEKLKMMLVLENEFPDLRAIEDAIKNKHQYIPVKLMPLSRDIYL